MRYQMRQKIFSFGDDYQIKDANENDVFCVDGRAFSIGNKLSFEDLNGRELAKIEQRRPKTLISAVRGAPVE